jgi:hypothetical protein
MPLTRPCCKSSDHWMHACRNKIHYRYGHIERACFSKRRAKSFYWQPKPGRANNVHSTGARSASGDPPKTAASSATSKIPVILSIISLPPPLAQATTSATPPLPQTITILVETRSTMANYLVNPEPFIPPEFEIEHGGYDRIPWAFVNLSGEPIYAHEQFTIAVDIQGVL